MIINIEVAGKYGILRDPRPRALPEEAWSGGANVRFVDGFAWKFSGHQEAYTSLPVAPYFLLPAVNDLYQFWLAGGLAKIYVHNGVVWTDITRVAGDYNATINDKWTGGILSGIVLMNNSGDNPQYWTFSVGSPMLDLPNWPPPGVTTMRAGVLRPFLSQIVVGDVTKDGTRYPTMVKWSSVADPGTVPGSWDETDATVLTGEKDLADTAGYIVDMAPMGRSNIIYKEDAVVAMTFVGGTFVYEFEWLSHQFGCFSPHCVAEQGTQTRHIALGFDDVVLVEGRRIQSIIQAGNRRWLFASMDVDNKNKSFVLSNQRRRETWICFPEQGATWCTLALVYNWDGETWGVRELPNISHGAAGVYVPEGGGTLFIDDLTTLIMDDALDPFDERGFSPYERSLLLVSPTNQKVYEFDVTEQADGVSFTSRLERYALGVNLSRRGDLLRDYENQKLVTRVIPHVEGSGTMNIYVGGQDTVDGPVTWQGPFPYVIGQDKDVECWISSALPAFRFETVGNDTWKLSGFSFEQKIVGKHW